MRLPKPRRTGDVVLVAVVVAALVVAAGLLNQVASEASSINSHAKQIAADTHGINVDTDAVHRLTRTNQLAGSILDSAKPLGGELGHTVQLADGIDSQVASVNGSAHSINQSVNSINSAAGSIDGHAKSILGSARSIHGTAGAIKATSGHINTLAAAILDVAGRINKDVQKININLDTTIAISRRIHAATQKLVSTGLLTRKEAACIDQEVHLAVPAYKGGAFCEQYQPTGTSDG